MHDCWSAASSGRWGLALAWSCSATNGYPTPAFCSGPLIFALFHAAEGLLSRRATAALAHTLLWGGLAVYSFANCFPYQSQPIWMCRYHLGDLFPKASHIWCDERSWQTYSELAELVKKYGKNFKTLPNIPLANYLTNTKPPIPLDWVADYELPGEWRDVALQLNKSGAVVFLRRTLMEAELLPYYEFGGINSTVSYYVKERWKKIESRRAFDVYIYDEQTTPPRLTGGTISRDRRGKINVAGEEGFEPSHAGSKDPCLNHLATPQRFAVFKIQPLETAIQRGRSCRS